MKFIFEAAKRLVQSRKSVLAPLVGMAGYISYSDHARFERMADAFSKGYMTFTLSKTAYTAVYFPRPELERRLRQILEPRFSNEYYLIGGEVGSGKSRTLQEVVRSMIEIEGSSKQGAPIYVLSSQGRCFSDSLAHAVRFHFDEHVTFQFFVQYALGIDRLPERDEHNKLERVLDAIEKASCRYAQRTGRPAVIVIDGTNVLEDHDSHTLTKLQLKAKLWADQNICKIIFVSNEERTEGILVKNRSCWSRVGAPIYVDDLNRDEALAFLQQPHIGSQAEEPDSPRLGPEIAERIYQLVGGRLHHLLACKKDASHHISFAETERKLLGKERMKFIGLSDSSESWKLVDHLWQQTTHAQSLAGVLKVFPRSVVDECIDRGIVRLVVGNQCVENNMAEEKGDGNKVNIGNTDSKIQNGIDCDSVAIRVQFESKLTENVVGAIKTNNDL